MKINHHEIEAVNVNGMIAGKCMYCGITSQRVAMFSEPCLDAGFSLNGHIVNTSTGNVCIKCGLKLRFSHEYSNHDCKGT